MKSKLIIFSVALFLWVSFPAYGALCVDKEENKCEESSNYCGPLAKQLRDQLVIFFNSESNSTLGLEAVIDELLFHQAKFELKIYAIPLNTNHDLYVIRINNIVVDCVNDGILLSANISQHVSREDSQAKFESLNMFVTKGLITIVYL